MFFKTCNHCFGGLFRPFRMEKKHKEQESGLLMTAYSSVIVLPVFKCC